MAQGFKTSIAIYTHDAWDSGEDFICIQMMGADLMSTIYRMKGEEGLICSPGVLIDADCDTIEKLTDFLMNPNKGIQSIRDYPLPSSSLPHMEIEYQEGMRYWLDGLKFYSEPETMEQRILQNFDPKGPKLPMLVGVAMGYFLDPRVALEAWEKPYQHPDDEEYLEKIYTEMPHMLMVVGVSTKTRGKKGQEKTPYLLVKNCHGPKWGKNGFSKMVFDMANSLCEPFLENKNMAYFSKRQKGN